MVGEVEGEGGLVIQNPSLASSPLPRAHSSRQQGTQERGDEEEEEEAKKGGQRDSGVTNGGTHPALDTMPGRQQQQQHDTLHPPLYLSVSGDATASGSASALSLLLPPCVFVCACVSANQHRRAL